MSRILGFLAFKCYLNELKNSEIPQTDQHDVGTFLKSSIFNSEFPTLHVSLNDF